MNSIRITSLQAPNQDFIVARLAPYLGASLGIQVEFISRPPWQERERLLDAGEIQAGWICGLPYVRKVDQENLPVELLAAPVFKGERYDDRPIYYSDVVVRRASQFQRFADLRGAAWAYNEPGSQSGYNITRYTLAQMGEKNAFFGKVIEAGSHQRALQMVLDREIDASAIDSTVLEIEIALRPEIEGQLCTIASLGPSPVPPWVAWRSLPGNLIHMLRDSLVHMHLEPTGQRVLLECGLRRFARVEDRDYDLIREMARMAEQVRLSPTEEVIRNARIS